MEENILDVWKSKRRELQTQLLAGNRRYSSVCAIED